MVVGQTQHMVRRGLPHQLAQIGVGGEVLGVGLGAGGADPAGLALILRLLMVAAGVGDHRGELAGLPRKGRGLREFIVLAGKLRGDEPAELRVLDQVDRIGGDEADRAGQPVRAVQRRGRAAQDLDLFDKAHIGKPAAPGILRAEAESLRRADAVDLHQHAVAADAELNCLAIGVYYESKGEPLEGQLAVAEVILNRAKSGRFPASVCGVLTQRGQFSFVRKGTIPQARRQSQAWTNAVALARIAHSGQWQTHADDALFFHATNRNKKSVTIDIKSAEDVEKLKKLVRSADILIQNLRPASAEDRQLVILVAAFIGSTRLIDNLALELEPSA